MPYAERGRVQRLRAAGLCTICGHVEARPGGRRCAACAERRAAVRRAYRAKAKAMGLCRDCGRPLEGGATQQYCEEHGEKARQYSQRFHAKRPTCDRRARNAYKLRWPERVRDQARRARDAYSLRWPGRARDQARAWYRKNSEHAREIKRKWHQRNPLARRLYNRASEARRRAAPGNCANHQAQARIDYYGGACYICGAPWEHIDHVIPLACGGTHWPANLRPICARCNGQKGMLPLALYLARRSTEGKSI